ncbi:MAG: 50S ribosomal protein L29 [Halanaerobacter sp.]
MKASELRNMTSEELEHELSELKDELFNLRFQNATVQLENPIRIREVKKTIARVKTILNERDLGINQG